MLKNLWNIFKAKDLRLSSKRRITGIFLTSVCTIVEKPKEEKSAPMGMPPGGMGGMDY